MATVEIEAGICCHTTTVRTTRGEAYNVRVSLESTCPHVWMIAGDLDEVDALQQIGLRGGPPSVRWRQDWLCLRTFPCA